MKEYENSLPDEDDLKKYPKDNPRKNDYDAYHNFNNNLNNNYFDDNLMNNNNNTNLIMNKNNEDNIDINVNMPQYANNLNNDQDSQKDIESVKQQEEINYQLFKGFLIKVYGIISFQLVITLIIILIFQIDSIKNYFLNRTGFTFLLNLISIGGFISTLVAISLKQDLAKKVPLNYITLIIMTIFVSFMCAFFSLNFSFELVLFCICLTCISAIAITVYIYNSEVNLSIIQAILYVIFGQGGGFLLMWLLLPNPMAEKVTYLVFTLLFGLYLVYDTQVIMKKFGEVYQIDDYILASIFIYMDIINLFMEILSVLGKNKKDK